MAPRLPLDRSARYGVGLMGTVFGGDILMTSDFSAVLQQADYSGTLGSDVPLLNVVQFFVIMGVLIASFAVMPIAPWRRVLAVTLVLVTMFLWAALGLLENAGAFDLDAQSSVGVLVDHGYVTVVIVLGGWLVVRGRHPLTWLLVGLAFAMPAVSQRMDDVGAPSGAYALVTEGAAFAACIGGAWLAALLDPYAERLVTPPHRTLTTSTRPAATAARGPAGDSHPNGGSPPARRGRRSR